MGAHSALPGPRCTNFAGSDDERARVRVMSHEPANEGELFLRTRPWNGKLDEGQPRKRLQSLRREKLDLRVAEYGRVERAVTSAARAGRARSLRAHARLLDERRTAGVVRVQDIGDGKCGHYDECGGRN